MSFEELKQPHVEQIIEGYIGLWYCPNQSHDKFLVVDSNGLELKRLNRSNIAPYFWDTEEQAHEASAQWYNIHGYLYPYNDEWEKSKNRIPIKNDVVQSQIMDFV